ncbi:hypothetical protein DPX16_6636 [Anabarilius grahami]|uniref:Uncharacterized protein n=1 Tax=Anabarilius grahami TaxID=495550 RepID=A0A3N0Z1I9_ANAGA|nr:hypothetical protein DPX16_6636 [Anabarilius grahami]
MDVKGSSLNHANKEALFLRVINMKLTLQNVLAENCPLRHENDHMTATKPKAPTEAYPELEPENTEDPEPRQANQSIAEPGADIDLIDLWSSDPPKSPPSNLQLLRRPLDSSAPVVSSSSLALPPPLVPCGSSTSPLASLLPAWLEAESPAASRAFRPKSLPRPVSSSPSPLLTAPSSPPLPVFPETPLGSLVTPGQPPVVDYQLPPRTSGISAARTPCTPTVSSGTSFPATSPLSLLAPASPRSSESPSLPPQSCKPAAQVLGFQACSVALVRQPIC